VLIGQVVRTSFLAALRRACGAINMAPPENGFARDYVVACLLEPV
jgi:hypothetical protein